MSRCILKTLRLLSALLAACAGALWIPSLADNARYSHMSLSSKFHIAVFDGCVHVFTDPLDPGAHLYTGGPANRRIALDNVIFYYRYVRLSPPWPSVWAFRAPLLPPLIVFTVLFVILTRFKRHAEEAAAGKNLRRPEDETPGDSPQATTCAIRSETPALHRCPDRHHRRRRNAGTGERNQADYRNGSCPGQVTEN